ncbi:unnamed protein product [Amaranthus hypochondriacus]
MEEKQVAIIGGGISGLLACKHLVEKGFKPLVFEAKSRIGGVWSQTLRSTKLQTPKDYYQFTDFPWPSTVKETFPHNVQVMQYLTAYASHFNLLPYFKFNSKVLSIDHHHNDLDDDDHDDDHDDDEWLVWGNKEGCLHDNHAKKWKVRVEDLSCHHLSKPADRVYEVDFVIICTGKYNLPYVPEFPKNKGIDIFSGKVLHSMEYAALQDDEASKLITNQKVTVVGFQKSAVDLAAEIGRQNGEKHPCTVLYTRAHWTVSESLLKLNFQLLNRFGELMIHKPGEGLLCWLLASLLSPLMWIFSKAMETYLKWIFPLRKYNTLPKHSYLNQVVSCMTAVLPTDFYDMVKQGSLVLKKAQTYEFYKNGLIIDGTNLPMDVVIFATGFKSEQNLKNIFSSTALQKLINGESSTPFYRECIHPRIHQLAILGYPESASNLFSIEMRSKWLAHLLAGKFKLPKIKEMEKDNINWQKCMVNYVGKRYKRSCVSVLLQIHQNDQLCKDMGYNPKRKKSFFSELFTPYSPLDYANIK